MNSINDQLNYHSLKFSWMNNRIFTSMKCQDEIKMHEIIFKLLFHLLIFNQIPQEVQINKMCQIYNWHPSSITTNTLFCSTNLRLGLLPRIFFHKFSHKILSFTLQISQLIFKIISHGPYITPKKPTPISRPPIDIGN